MTKVQQDLLLKEEQLVRVSTKIIYGCALALVATAVWLTSLELKASQTEKDFDAHVKSGAEYRAINDKRWLRINNALIRLQEKQGVEIPRAELTDPLDE